MNLRIDDFLFVLTGTGTASIRVKDINDMPPSFTKDEWQTEVDETDGINLPETPILTVTVHDEDETNKFQYKVRRRDKLVQKSIKTRVSSFTDQTRTSE